eukprot:TRINITY_DN8827_c0_g1_i1.p1 TRINITY_DN8827_c0_g1~~TRINITY_DN8827_c0_g1_i1.p1  ORF type:complete len:726 (-),score=20.83 TRINITY_DN8827_c0_g1_i1:206-2383(-)
MCIRDRSYSDRRSQALEEECDRFFQLVLSVALSIRDLQLPVQYVRRIQGFLINTTALMNGNESSSLIIGLVPVYSYDPQKCFSINERWFAMFFDDFTVKIFDLETQTYKSTFTQHLLMPIGIVVINDLMIASYSSSELFLWNPQTLDVLTTFTPSERLYAGDVLVFPKQESVVLCYRDIGDLEVLDLETLTHRERVNCCDEAHKTTKKERKYNRKDETPMGYMAIHRWDEDSFVICYSSKLSRISLPDLTVLEEFEGLDGLRDSCVLAINPYERSFIYQSRNQLVHFSMETGERIESKGHPQIQGASFTDCIWFGVNEVCHQGSQLCFITDSFLVMIVDFYRDKQIIKGFRVRSAASILGYGNQTSLVKGFKREVVGIGITRSFNLSLFLFENEMGGSRFLITLIDKDMKKKESTGSLSAHRLLSFISDAKDQAIRILQDDGHLRLLKTNSGELVDLIKPASVEAERFSIKDEFTYAAEGSCLYVRVVNELCNRSELLRICNSGLYPIAVDPKVFEEYSNFYPMLFEPSSIIVFKDLHIGLLDYQSNKLRKVLTNSIFIPQKRENGLWMIKRVLAFQGYKKLHVQNVTTGKSLKCISINRDSSLAVNPGNPTIVFCLGSDEANNQGGTFVCKMSLLGGVQIDKLREVDRFEKKDMQLQLSSDSTTLVIRMSSQIELWDTQTLKKLKEFSITTYADEPFIIVALGEREGMSVLYFSQRERLSYCEI